MADLGKVVQENLGGILSFLTALIGLVTALANRGRLARGRALAGPPRFNLWKAGGFLVFVVAGLVGAAHVFLKARTPVPAAENRLHLQAQGTNPDIPNHPTPGKPGGVPTAHPQWRIEPFPAGPIPQPGPLKTAPPALPRVLTAPARVAPATLVLEISPPQATVVVDHQIVPASFHRPGEALRIEVGAGAHEVTVSHEHFQPLTQHLILKTGVTGPVKIHLEPLKR